jgi:streptogramin lyase
MHQFISSTLAVAAAAASLFAQAPTPYHRAVIKPSIARMATGGQQRFKVVILATRLMAAQAPKSVKWSVNDIPGGNAEVGTIDAHGLYRAPAKVPVPNEVSVRGDVEGSANRYVWSTVLVGTADPAYKVVGGWSEDLEAKEARLREPHGISIDKQGRLLIVDQRAGRVFRYTKDGKFLGEIGKGHGSEAGQFSEPRYAHVDAAGNIYTTDVKGDRPRLQVFSPDGKFLRIFAEKGTLPGMILRGHGLWFDSKGRLYATDVDNMRVNIFDPSGKFLFSFGKDGPEVNDFNAPHGLYLDANDDVFVNSYYGPTKKFDSEGHYLFSFAHGDPPEGSVFFHSMTGDRRGNAYLTVRTKAGYDGAVESNAGRKVSIAKYNNNGDFVCNMSMSVPEHTESWAAVDADGTIYSLFKSKKRAGVEILKQQ